MQGPRAASAVLNVWFHNADAATMLVLFSRNVAHFLSNCDPFRVPRLRAGKPAGVDDCPPVL